MPRQRREVTQKQPKNVTTESIVDLRQFVGDTADDYGVEDFTVPFIILLQDKSKRVTEGGPHYIEGARPGMLFNSAENCVYTRTVGLDVIPCAYKTCYIEWISREAGGGIVGIYEADQGKEMLKTCDINDRNKRILPNGNELALNHQHYVLVIPKGEDPFPAIMPMAASQIKKSKQWNYRINRFRTIEPGQLQPDPSWCRVWHATSVLDEAKGHTFYSWSIDEPQVIQDAELLDQARAFRAACRQGIVKSDEAGLEDTE